MLATGASSMAKGKLVGRDKGRGEKEVGTWTMGGLAAGRVPLNKQRTKFE